MVDDARWDAFCRKRDAVARELERLKSTRSARNVVARHDAERVLGQPIEREYSLAELLRRPGVTYRALHALEGVEAPECADDVVDQVEVSIKYQGYIDRQHVEVAARSRIRPATAAT